MLSLWQFVMKYYFNLCILYQLELLVSPQSLAPQVIFVSHNYVSKAVTMKKVASLFILSEKFKL